MAPPKVLNNQTTTMMTRRGMATRTQNGTLGNSLLAGSKIHQPILGKDTRLKRKADASPTKDKLSKRSALGNITNAIGKTVSLHLQDTKKVLKKSLHTQTKVPAQTKAAAQTKAPTQTNTLRTLDKILAKPENVVPVAKPKPMTRVKIAAKKEDEKVEVPNKMVNVRRSLDLEKSDDSSLYVSALEEVPEDAVKKCTRTSAEEENVFQSDEAVQETIVKPPTPTSRRRNVAPKRELLSGVQWDFDGENWTDPYQVSYYAMDIFNYLKERESLFPISDYMERQVCLSRWMRSLLVDWMVEVQESFELNHETLYLAVKLVDLYLTKVTVGKETLQLLGAASLFIASKFDERIPPMIEDFLYICDGAYSQRELIRMEMNVLKVMNFDLGIPLSYRFLRRYARCAKVSMPTLTLARYILEYSLMDYATVSLSDSKMAAAALFLALEMKDLGGWTKTLEYYTGYKISDISEIVKVLNEGLHRKPKETIATVRNKYSHKIFFEVAKVPLKDVISFEA